MNKHLEQIKSTWSWNHKLLIVCFALVLANVLQTFPISFPTYAVAYQAPKEVEVTPEALLEKYTQEMHAEMYKEAQIRATRRLFEELGVIVDELNPEK